ncbi:MAG: cupin domain-containing protein, partial [Flavobacterium sp.]
MKNNSNSRRDAIQQLGLLSAGMFMLSSNSCTDDKIANDNLKETKGPLPFLIPAQKPLETGTMGNNMRTLIRSTQTNNQFSCVEAVLAPKKIAGSPHKHDKLDELMYVLEGTASILMGDEVVEVKAGCW